jgi:hypothetical protein
MIKHRDEVWQKQSRDPYREWSMVRGKISYPDWLRAHTPSYDRDLLLKRPTIAQMLQKKIIEAGAILIAKIHDSCPMKLVWNSKTGKKELWPANVSRLPIIPPEKEKSPEKKALTTFSLELAKIDSEGGGVATKGKGSEKESRPTDPGITILKKTVPARSDEIDPRESNFGTAENPDMPKEPWANPSEKPITTNVRIIGYKSCGQCSNHSEYDDVTTIILIKFTWSGPRGATGCTVSRRSPRCHYSHWQVAMASKGVRPCDMPVCTHLSTRANKASTA